MHVSRPDFESLVEQVRAEVDDPRGGVFGPGSAVWRLARESVVFLGGGRAALLQAAHPYVAQAIQDHSRTKTDLAGRFYRTFDHVFAMVFGDLDNAVESARRVRAIHERVHGHLGEDVGPYRSTDAYEANDAEALHWVHATLMHTTLQVHELVVGRVPARDKERFYQEGRRFAHLFGVPDHVMPADWPAFEQAMQWAFGSRKITVGPAARDICAHLFDQPPRPSLAPLWRWYTVMTAGLLPQRLRIAYGLPWGRAERALFRSSILGLRLSYRHIPARLRVQPAYRIAHRRLQGRRESSVYGSFVEALLLWALRGQAS